MKLIVMVPSEVLIDRETEKVTAEDEDGFFCLLPRHLDVVTALVPGLLVHEPVEYPPEYIAVDGGVLVKCGSEVFVSTPQAVVGGELGTLKQSVEKTFRRESEKEKQARTALSSLQVNFIDRLLEMEERGG